MEARKEDTLAKTLPDIKIEEDQSFSTPDHVQNDFVPTAAVFASPVGYFFFNPKPFMITFFDHRAT